MRDLKGALLRQANSLLRSFGVQLERTTKRRSIADFLSDRRVGTIYDVGANQGQFGSAMRREGYRGRLISFEPLKDPFAHLLQKAKEEALWDARNYGLSSDCGQQEINVSKYSVFSSFMPMKPTALEFHEEAEVVGREVVELRTLDSVFQPSGEPTFLKIDTQGYEKAVLEGGKDALRQFCGVLMEIPIVQLYDGVWQFEEAVAYMRSKGFVLSNLMPNNFDIAADAVSLLEVDCLFKNIG